MNSRFKSVIYWELIAISFKLLLTLSLSHPSKPFSSRCTWLSGSILQIFDNQFLAAEVQMRMLVGQNLCRAQKILGDSYATVFCLQDLHFAWWRDAVNHVFQSANAKSLLFDKICQFSLGVGVADSR